MKNQGVLMYRFNYAWIILVISFSLLSGCHSAPLSEESSAEADIEEVVFARNGNSDINSANLNKQLAELRRVTAPYNRFVAAQEDGYTDRITECMSSPEGSMGFHYAKSGLIDARAAVDEPESLLYEPEPNGRLRLVGVEYIVPFDAWTESDPPSLFDQHFHRNEEFGIWALHVWVWNHNPNGLFADWNPRVSC